MDTRFDIIRALDAKGIIEAYLNGKPVEYLNNDSMEWVKVDQDHEWNFEKYQVPLQVSTAKYVYFFEVL